MAAPCNVTRSSGIMTLNWPGGSTLQCGRWLWDDMPLNSPKRPPYWNFTSGLISTTSPQSTCHSAPICEILFKSDNPRQKKMTSRRFSRWRISAILDFRNPIMVSMILDCYRAMLCKRGLCCHAVSVRLSVRLSRSWITSKRINVSSKFFHLR